MFAQRAGDWLDHMFQVGGEPYLVPVRLSWVELNMVDVYATIAATLLLVIWILWLGLSRVSCFRRVTPFDKVKHKAA